MVDLIMELDGHLDPNFCDEIIKRFDDDSRKHPGCIDGLLNTDCRISLDLCINRFQNWDDVTNKLKLYIRDGIEKYIEWLGVMFPTEIYILKRSLIAIEIRSCKILKYIL